MDMYEKSAGAPVKIETGSTLKRFAFCLTSNPNAVVVLFGAYFLLQIIVRQLVPPALRVDEAQQVLFAQWLALGYDAQPPLYNWYQQAVFAVFGTSMATIALAKNFILFLTFAAFVKTAELVLENKRFVVVAALALFVIPQVFWQAQRDLTHTAMLMLTFTMLLYGSIRLIQRPSLMGYVLVGVVAGLGMLSKYNFALALPALLVAVWFHPQGRARLLDRRFLLTVLVSVVVFLPHLFWLVDNIVFASEVTLKRMAEDAPDNRFLQVGRGLARFVAGSLIIVAVPALLLWLTALREQKLPRRTQSAWFRFFLHYFIAIATLMALVIFMTTMTELRDRWLLPLLLPAPILAALYLERCVADADRFVLRFLPIPLIMLALVPVALLISYPLMASIGRTSSSNYDWQAFKRQIVETEKLSPSVIVTLNWPTGGNLRFLFNDVPVATAIYDDYDPPFTITDEHPALMAWIGDDDQSPELSKWIEGQLNVRVKDVKTSTLSVPMYYPIKGKMLRLNYAVARPANMVRD
ncbi:glycosyltransferase family 39 protein [Agrobacterium vaccinii]|uniref:glycosyltransferase family 39 protein n=1 Tax=Agrobacterium vaccinii TaxID=2735528 RepID=UPI001E5806B3|nr:glycosyltransferase family 39 protein [Agrobacterium vaccinii]UHS59374.1 glycosyltransferase family 39 protein [Agrobacterium vaccinii]